MFCALLCRLPGFLLSPFLVLPVVIAVNEFADLTTYHLLGNLEVEITAVDNATCRASMLIWRAQCTLKGSTLRDAASEFHTHCLYMFRLVKEAAAWNFNKNPVLAVPLQAALRDQIVCKEFI